ncbi:hypothetical protein OROGR_022903 [Orobanche gracilis]
MRGLKCSINGYVRLGINAQADEFWFRIGRRLIRFSRFEYALVTGMRFGDSDFDIHGDDVHIEGSVYDRYPILSSGGQMLDRIRGRFATGYFRQQPGDALKVAKVLCLCYLLFGFDGGKHIADRWLWTSVEDQTRWESFPSGGYSYQILVTYLREIPIEILTGLNPSYHFYGNIYVIMIWACDAIPSLGSKCGNILGASFIQRPSCTRWKLKKLGPVAFTTFFDDQIDCFEVLVPTPEEEEEPYMMSICDEASERVQYTHRMPLFKKGVVGRGKGKGKGKGRARDGDSSGRERIVRQRTSGPVISDSPYVIAGRKSSVEPHEHVHTDAQPMSSPIRGSHQTASSSARGTEETTHITDLDTLFTQLRQYVDSTAQQIYRYIDTIAQETRRHIDTTAEEIRRLRKRKDLDEEAYCRWLDSDESVNVGAACGVSVSWFLMLQDGSKLIDAEHLDAYMGILQFDPLLLVCDGSMIGLTRLFWSIRDRCINVWNNRMSRKGSSMIDSDDLAFLVSHIHGLRPFWGDHRTWRELREVLTIWNTSPESSSGHWVLLRIHLEESVICMHDSLAQEQKAWLKLRGRQSTGLSRLIPIILREAGFYERRLDITPVESFRVVVAKKDECYIQDDATSCGAFAIQTLESLIQGSFSHGKTETDIYAFRGRMTRAIWRFSNNADSVVCDLTSLFIPIDDVH